MSTIKRKITDASSYTLINDNCYAAMKDIPDQSVNLILTDPPYNIAGHSTGNIKIKGRADINTDIAEWDLMPVDIHALSKEFCRILSPKGNIFIFTSYNLFGEYFNYLDPIFDSTQFMIWHKTNPTPSVRKTSFLSSCELILSFWNKGHTWNFISQKEMHNFIESSICMGGERLKDKNGKTLHPTQKPIVVLKKIIRIASNENDVVLDCFSGTGSTGAAAICENRRYIGIESNPLYFDASEKRLAAIAESISNTNCNLKSKGDQL